MKYLRELALLRCGESYDNQGRLSKGFQGLLLDYFAKKIYYNCQTCKYRDDCKSLPDPFKGINEPCDKYFFDKKLLRGEK